MKYAVLLMIVLMVTAKLRAVDSVDPVTVRIEPIFDKYSLRIEEIANRDRTTIKEIGIISNDRIYLLIQSEVTGSLGNKVVSYKLDDINEDGVPELIIKSVDYFGKGVSTSMSIVSLKINYWGYIFKEQQSRFAAHVYPSQGKISGAFTIIKGKDPVIRWDSDKDNEGAISSRMFVFESGQFIEKK